MIQQELLKKVRQIEFTTRRMVNDVMTGQYRSSFKGQGVQFSDHRIYVPGDDVRHIDWKVSARSRETVIKKFDEERELTLFLIVDVSGSESFGSNGKLKSEVAAEVGAILAFAATVTGDKVGALLFGGEVEKIIPPKKGKQHVLRIVRDLLGFQAKTPGTNLARALESAGKIMKHKGIVFVLSDFMASNYEIPLRRLARKHDVVAIRVSDERESHVPNVGYLMFSDPETGDERMVDTGGYAFKKWFKESHTAHETDLETAFKGGRVEQLKIMTREDHGEAVVRFFRARARRRR